MTKKRKTNGKTGTGGRAALLSLRALAVLALLAASLPLTPAAAHKADEKDTSWIGDETSMGDGSSTSGDTYGALEDPELYACYLDAYDSEPQMMTHYQCLSAHLQQWWVPSFMDMTRQLIATAMQQVLIVGKFMDAKTQLETQLLMDRMKAEAHADYHPDSMMCRIGTNARALAQSENQYKANTRILYNAMLQRSVMASDGITAGGPRVDYPSRLEQFKKKFCDKEDDNGYLKNNPPTLPEALCGDGPSSKKQISRDIDYTRTIENTYTLDVNFTDKSGTDGLTDDEEDVLALTRNLIGHPSLIDIPKKHLQHEYAKDGYQDMRSLYALRSVAQNSLSHIIGMRSKGGESLSISNFTRRMMEELQIPAGDVEKFIGRNPSYFAQMELLTSIMYENPVFYTNLYTKPVNVERIGLALEGIKLMQDRDRYESALRREMLVSTILEMKLRELQDRVGDTTLQGLTIVLPGAP